MPDMPGIRWSATSSATWSPRRRTSRSVSSASAPGAGAQDPVALAEAAAQVAGDGGEHGRLVVDGEDGGTAGSWVAMRRERYPAAQARPRRDRALHFDGDVRVGRAGSSAP